jgi:hypothetical protein
VLFVVEGFCFCIVAATAAKPNIEAVGSDTFKQQALN